MSLSDNYSYHNKGPDIGGCPEVLFCLDQVNTASSNNSILGLFIILRVEKPFHH